jgi:hypothetical protein
MTMEANTAVDTQTSTPVEDVPPQTNQEGAASSPGEGQPQGAQGVSEASPPPEAAPTPPAGWPEDWRAALAGGDAELAKEAERYTEPNKLLKSLVETKKKLRSRAAIPRPGQNATPEEWAEYKELSGIPQQPADYKLELSEGRVLSETEQPIVNEFLERAHKDGLDNKAASAAVDFWVDYQARTLAAQQKADDEFRERTKYDLKERWGQRDFDRNVRLIENFLVGMPPSLKDRLLPGRLADGKLIGDDPEMLAWLVDEARDKNPTATLLPAGNQNMQGLQARKDAIRKLMQDEDSEYWKGPNREKLQNEYRDLLSAEERMGRRA